MKTNILSIALLALVLGTFGVHAGTTNIVNLLTNDVSSSVEKQGWELTVGGGGLTVPTTGHTEFGLDVSLETNPFQNLRSLWIGVEQGIAFSPVASGATDVFAEWSFNVYKEKVFINTGVNAGVSYDPEATTLWRVGPETSLQYFTSDNSFIYAQTYYDFNSHGDSGFRYNIGIGLAW